MQAPSWYVEPEHVDAWKRWHDIVTKGGDPTEALTVTQGLCRDNPAFLLQNYTEIVDKDFAARPFRPWTPPQVRLYHCVRSLERRGVPVRIVIVKPRQTGISTMIEGLGYQHCGFNDNRRAMVMAHEEDPGLINIYRMFQRFHHSVPEAFRPKLDASSMEKMEFSNGSILTHKTAALGSIKKSAMGKGRGATYSFLHGSEVAYWPVPESFIRGIMDGVPRRPGTAVFLESTANGHGDWFHRRWRRAAKGWRMTSGPDGVSRWAQVERNDGLWIPFFISWLEQPEYRLPLADDTQEERAAFVRSYDPDEQRLFEEYGATPEQIRWRRWQVDEEKDGDVDDFKKEYPAEPEEAFAFSGRKVFDINAMRDMADAARKRELKDKDLRGHLVERH